MRNLNPLRNTGVLVNRVTDSFLGNCFVYRSPDRFLTAAHCIGQISPADLGIVLPYTSLERVFEVSTAVAHPEADVAVLTVPSVREDDITWPPYDVFNDQSWGQDFMAFGYPLDYEAVGPRPTARVFRGHIQRFFQHTSHMGYRYLAAELSTGAPLGLSGASVFHDEFQGRLYGVVAENVRTTSELETVLEVQDGAKSYREEQARVINYGVAVWLAAISDWLDRQIPPLPTEEIHRRALNQQDLNRPKPPQ